MPENTLNTAAPLVNLGDMDRKTMEQYFAGMGEKAFRAAQVVQWVHRRGITDFQAMTDLSKPLRERLATTARITFPEIVNTQESADGTRKWLLRMEDGNCLETVFIPERDRGTLCVSSQAGCAMKCGFCATGQQGYSRNLSVSEIIGQLWVANQTLGYYSGNHKHRVITNVVLMGMGEPLLNLDNVCSAIRLMLDDLAYGLARRRVTVSTVGVVPAMDKLQAATNVSLAISLHASNNTLRDTLIPLNRKYPLEELLAAAGRYSLAQYGESITYEYVMLDGVNDSERDARDLIKLLRGTPAKVNLIPFNTFPGAGFQRSSQTTIDRFREILMNAGIIAITRRPRGEDIDAACGQLVGLVTARARHPVPEAGKTVPLQ